MKFERKTLSDLGIVVTGKTPSTKNSQFWDGEIPFVTPKDIQFTKHIFKTERNITEQGLMNVKGSTLSAGSICVSCIGNIGYVGITIKRCVSNQQINSIIVNKAHDRDFVYYIIKNLWKFFKSYEGQSTALSILNKTQFSKIQVDVPSLNEQRQIAGILSRIDDKIELNNAINNNLQQQSIALFQKTFPYCIDDELPEGWRVATVGEIIELHDSKRIPLSGGERDKMEKKIYPYYGATSFMDYVDDFIFDGIYLLLGEDGTVIDANGYPALQYVWGKFWVNNHAHIITGKLGFSVESLWVLFHLTSVRSIVTGAVQPKISQANLRSIRVVLPPFELLKAYDESIQPMFSAIRNNTNENERLSSLRDTLLPKLMSGEIDVSDIEI